MALVPALCTQCGSYIEVDPSRDAAICPHCGTPFITEKVINNYQTTNITNIGNLHADTVHVAASDSAENLLQTADTFLSLKEWDKARKAYTEVTEKYPYKAQAWFGCIRGYSENCTVLDSDPEYYFTLLNLYKHGISQLNGEKAEVEIFKDYFRKLAEYVNNSLKQQQLEKNKVFNNRVCQLETAINPDLPTDIIKEKCYGYKFICSFWWIFTILFGFLSLLFGIPSAFMGEDIDVDLGFLVLEGFDSGILESLMVLSLIALIIRLIPSFITMLVGLKNILFQKKQPVILESPLHYLCKWPLIISGVHLALAFINSIIVSFKDPGSFFSYNGGYRIIHTLLFSNKFTETGAAWLLFLLITIYTITNACMCILPLTLVEKIGKIKTKKIYDNKKLIIEKNMLQNQHTQEMSNTDRTIIRIKESLLLI